MIRDISSFRLYLFAVLYLLWSPSISAQEISLSEGLNIRNYFAYELLGEVNERIIVYRDKGFTKEINVFDQFMQQTTQAELNFEEKRIEVIHSMGLDSVFQMIYSYVKSDSIFVRMRRYDQSVSLADSTLLLGAEKSKLTGSFDYFVSEDKSKVGLLTVNKEGEFGYYLFENSLGRLRSAQSFVIPGFDIKRDKRHTVMTNSGDLMIAHYDRYTKSTGENTLILTRVSMGSETLDQKLVDFESHHRRDIIMDYDNLNDRVLLCGTYAAERGKDPNGYYLLNNNFQSMPAEVLPLYMPFSSRLINEVSRSKRKKKKVFQNFWVKDLIKRQDGGFLILMESYAEYSRRSSYGAGADRNSYSGAARRGWVDYYNEDIIISSINPQMAVDWTKILYKKQFSQDDEAIFSSYFIMKTPSRLRLIYNDEIKRNSTVSEYILAPTGKVKRNSLMSTANQELKLRFRDAVQLSNNQLLVPSEKNYELSLVKISY